MSSQVACVQCRQQKVRCIGRDTATETCDRCRKRGLECIVDNNFKRTVKRQAVEDLRAEIAELRAQLAAATAPVLAPTPGTDVREGEIKDAKETKDDKPPDGHGSKEKSSSVDSEDGLDGKRHLDEEHMGLVGRVPKVLATTSTFGGSRSANDPLTAGPHRSHLGVMPPRFEARLAPGAQALPPVVAVESWTCSPKTARSPNGDLTLDSSTIELLFREYVEHYHRVLPVVEVQRGPEFVYGASEALFWTMMALASRRRAADLPQGVDFDRLCDAQKQYLSEIAVSPVLGQQSASPAFNLPSLYAVQAFILCTLWPPPTASINADMSWNTAGIAILTAVRAGLHCPGYAQDFERIFRGNQHIRTNMREQLVTWLATNALAQAIANMFGYPSSADFRAHREYLFHNIELPPRVRHMYEIQRNAHDIASSLGSLGQKSGPHAVGLEASMATSLIRVHAARYDQIEAEFGPQMDAWTLFTLHAGRAQLFSYYMFTDIHEESMLLLYNACLTLLNHVVQQPDEYMKYLPVVSVMILWQTASVVAKLQFSRWADNLDKTAGERLYRAVIKRVLLSSVFEHDLPYRAAEIMTQMWGTFRAMRRARNERLISGRLTLRSRMSASAFFDSLWLMREGTEIHSHAPTTLTKHTPEGFNRGVGMKPKHEKEGNKDAQNNVQMPSDLGNQTGLNAIPRSNNVTSRTPSTGIPEPVQPQHLQHLHPPPAHHLQHVPNLQPGVDHMPASLQSDSLGFQSQHPHNQMQHNVQHNQHSHTQHNQTQQNMSQHIHHLHVQHEHHNHSNQQPIPPNQQQPFGQDWSVAPLPPLSALLSPDPNTVLSPHKSPVSPVSPASSALIDGSWSDMDPDAASTIWRDVNAVMEDFGFGLGELPYISP